MARQSWRNGGIAVKDDAFLKLYCTHLGSILPRTATPSGGLLANGNSVSLQNMIECLT